MTPIMSACVRLDSTTLTAATYNEHRETLQLDFRDGTRYCIRELRRPCFVSCSSPPLRDPFSTGVFEAAFLMPKSLQKTKRHWALASGPTWAEAVNVDTLGHAL